MELKKFIDKKPYVIAGPCSAESEEQILQIAKELKGTADVFRAGVWKPRTKPNSADIKTKSCKHTKTQTNGILSKIFMEIILNRYLTSLYQLNRYWMPTLIY